MLSLGTDTGPPYFGGTANAKSRPPSPVTNSTPLTETLWLVRNGQHPDQLALCPSRQVPFQSCSSLLELHDRLLSSTSPIKQARPIPIPIPIPIRSPPPPPGSPPQPRRTETVNTYFLQKPSDVRKIYCLDYHFHLYDRADFKAEIPSPCQQRTRCEMVEMPRARNSPWQISNCAGYKNSTRG